MKLEQLRLPEQQGSRVLSASLSQPLPRGACGTAWGHSTPCPQDLNEDRNQLHGYPSSCLVPSALRPFLPRMLLLALTPSEEYRHNHRKPGLQSERPGLAEKTRQVSTVHTQRSLPPGHVSESSVLTALPGTVSGFLVSFHSSKFV